MAPSPFTGLTRVHSNGMSSPSTYIYRSLAVAQVCFAFFLDELPDIGSQLTAREIAQVGEVVLSAERACRCYLSKPPAKAADFLITRAFRALATRPEILMY